MHTALWTSIATALVWTLQLYAALGLLFAIPFVVRGVGRIDPAARGGTWGFRMLIVPGVVAFWPFLAWRWATGAPPPRERNAHRNATREATP